MNDDELILVISAISLIAGFLIVYRFLNWIESKGKRQFPGNRQRGSEADSRSEKQAHGERSEGQASADFGNKRREWFEVLDVARDSSVDEIRLAYRIAIALYHPDKVASLASEFRSLANVRSQEINAAYDTARKIRGFK